MTLALIAALPFLGAVLAALGSLISRRAAAIGAGLATSAALALLLSQVPAVLAGTPVMAGVPWVPALGLNASLFLDGLGLFFALLILGIGLLIIIYAGSYLSKADPAGPFFSYLMLFQGAMTGIVLSDNILLLLVFWELTSLSSFLLIGFWRHLPEARQGARMALAITGAGGLAMFAGLLLLGQIAGSYDLTVILQRGDDIRASSLYLPALLLILIGAFTKSAQFPFHFWLPHAMAAPTPVSAYLHSATMVKAGLFLLARLWPVLSGTPEWFLLVTTTGLVTMLVGAKIAFYQDDLKGLLAYSTVSQLGLICMLLGFGTEAAAVVAMFHILNHASFKAALFLTTGIVDHETHTRSLKRLGGLRHLMPVTFTLAAVASLSMAGIPPFNGFLSKEMMLEEAAHTHWLGSDWLLPALVVVGALFSVAYSFRFLGSAFLGPERTDYPHHPHDPGPGLWGPPAILVGLVLLIGLFPMTLAAWLVNPAAAAVTGADVTLYAKHWHGAQAASLWMSLAAIGGGLVLIGLQSRLLPLWESFPRPEGKRIFDALLAGLVRASRALAEGLHDGGFARMSAIAVAAIAALCGLAWTGGFWPGPTRALTPVNPVVVLGWLMLCGAALAVGALHRQRLLALLLLGIVGLTVSVSFAFMSAPDLALTQITVEVVTIILLLLALNYLPRATPPELPSGHRLGALALAGLAGTGVAWLTWAMTTTSAAFAPISGFHLAESKPGGGGTNAVNVIIVDFRGYDTFGEIIVLGIAALVISAVVAALLKPGPANDRLLGWIQGRDAGDRHPLMLAVATRLILPLAITVGVYLYLRGHNVPGGGFVAGLVVAIALVLQYIASGFAWAEARMRLSYVGLIGAGVLVASATGAVPFLFGLPFLTSTFGYVTIPPLEKFEVASAAAFDLGVFLCVLGAVMLALSSLSRIAIRAGETVNLRPYDVDPGRTEG